MAAHHDPSKIQSHLRELKVLMVEDNELNHLLARVVLKKIGWVLDSAMNGIEALEKLKHNKYDIVLMDIQMPEMDGIEATQRIRTELKATHGQTPIIACSALKLELKKWLEAGMNDYISKPFQSEELMEKVSGLLIKNTISLTDRADGAKENMEQEPVINLQNLYKFSGNSDETVKSIIEVFLQQAPDQMNTLISAMELKDWNNVKILCHRMKSSYAIIGANSVRALLQTIEDDCTQNKVDEAKFKTLLNNVIELNEAVVKYISTIAGK